MQGSVCVKSGRRCAQGSGGLRATTTPRCPHIRSGTQEMRSTGWGATSWSRRSCRRQHMRCARKEWREQMYVCCEGPKLIHLIVWPANSNGGTVAGRRRPVFGARGLINSGWGGAPQELIDSIFRTVCYSWANQVGPPRVGCTTVLHNAGSLAPRAAPLKFIASFARSPAGGSLGNMPQDCRSERGFGRALVP